MRSRPTFFVEIIVGDPVVEETAQHLPTDRNWSDQKLHDVCVGTSADPVLYLSGEVGGGVTAESQHVVQLLGGAGDERDRLLLVTFLLQLPQTADELWLCGINQTCGTGRRSVCQASASSNITHIGRLMSYLPGTPRWGWTGRRGNGRHTRLQRFLPSKCRPGGRVFYPNRCSAQTAHTQKTVSSFALQLKSFSTNNIYERRRDAAWRGNKNRKQTMKTLIFMMPAERLKQVTTCSIDIFQNVHQILCPLQSYRVFTLKLCNTYKSYQR